MIVEGRRVRWRPWLGLVLSATLWGATLPILAALEDARDDAGLQDLWVAQGLEEVASTALLGGFRAVAVDFLMIRAQGQMEEGRFYELMALYERVTRMVPRHEPGWIYLSWNLTFNIPAEVRDPDARWSFVRKGIQLCRRGQERIPRSWQLPYWEGVILLQRCAEFPVLSARLQADEALNPAGLSVERLALEKGWEALSIDGHRKTADVLVREALDRLIRKEGLSPSLREEARRFWSHLAEDGDRAGSFEAWWRGLSEGDRRGR